MSSFRNKAISASAGTGKTFRLAHRYIALMAAEVSSDRICALTFSRKAAGEIFDRIVNTLCDAATSDAKCALTAETIARENIVTAPTSKAAYLQFLRELLDKSHRLRISTLDSFIYGVVRAFPLELGIPPNIAPMDGDGGDAIEVRRTIMHGIFDPARGTESARAFMRSFQQSVHGEESKSLEKHLDKSITDYFPFYLQHPAPQWHWGDTSAIWRPNQRWWETPWCKHPPPSNGKIYDRLIESFGGGARPSALASALAKIVEVGFGHSSHNAKPEGLSDTLVKQLLSLKGDTQAAPQITYYRQPYQVPEDIWPFIRQAVNDLMAGEIERVGNKSAGLASILASYAEIYAEMLANEGRFTFDDISRLLGAGELVPSIKPLDANTESNRLYIDYRLDGQLDHWLLDEFQDTSDIQWATLANLVEEVISDENRSLFYVGDIKQSIYGWRGGNRRLFGQIAGKYNEPDYSARGIATESINVCYRSLPNVLNAVNAIFGGLDTWEPVDKTGKSLNENKPRDAAIKDFMAAWKRHESRPDVKHEGFACLLEYEGTKRAGSRKPEETSDSEEDDAELDPAMLLSVAKIIEDAEPQARDLTCAVLLRTNDQARQCVEVLRRHLPGVAIAHEGRGGIMDHPVVTLFIALFRYAAHPGDTVALRHLQMSRLWKHTDATLHQTLPTTIMEQLHRDGFAATIRHWAKSLGEIDAFASKRMDDLLRAAEIYDARNSIDVDAFGDFVENYAVSMADASGTVRVMTVHQSKGLEFDIVIVPLTNKGKSFGSPASPTLVASLQSEAADRSRSVTSSSPSPIAARNWVILPPSKDYREAAGGDLKKAHEAALEDANFEQLCTLYVSLTRAKSELYMLVPTLPDKIGALYESNLLRDNLITDTTKLAPINGVTCLAQLGQREKATQATQSASATEATSTPESLPLDFASRIPRHEPSKELLEKDGPPLQWYFTPEAGDVRIFGAELHRLFERIEWIEDADTESIVSEWRHTSSASPRILDDVEKQFRTCLENPDVRDCLSRPTGEQPVEIWREAPFNLVLEIDGEMQLLSGRFDRVTIRRDDASRALSAEILDYKSNRIRDMEDLKKATEGYATQMTRYREAVCTLLNLPMEKVAAKLIFTRKGWIAQAL